jgi:hypothetical protein
MNIRGSGKNNMMTNTIKKIKIWVKLKGLSNKRIKKSNQINIGVKVREN